MDHQTFNELVKNRLENCEQVLGVKNAEYASEGDRLHNFKKAARMTDRDPVLALDGMWLKHRVSVADMVEKLIADPYYVPSKELVAEKFGDNHNYLLLLEALIEERRVVVSRVAVAR